MAPLFKLSAAFLAALAASLIFTGLLRRLAIRIGMVDLPGPRKVHSQPTPLLGGVAIYAGFLLAIPLALRDAEPGQILAVVGGASLLILTGFLDDAGKLHHQMKLFLGMPLAACFLLAAGVHARIFASFIPGELARPLDLVLTLVWVVGITASFSILDHMDGLCAGVAAIAAAFFAAATFADGQYSVAIPAAAAFGATLGFLRWNFSPAKIFMGDGGAMLLGFLMATFSLELRPTANQSQAAWLLPILVLGVPIFDTSLIIISRSRRGLLPFTSPGKDHTAHRLSSLGLGQKRAVLLLYGFCLLSGSLGLLVCYVSPHFAPGICAALLLLATLAFIFLERSPFERQQTPRQSLSSSSSSEPSLQILR